MLRTCTERVLPTCRSVAESHIPLELITAAIADIEAIEAIAAIAAIGAITAL